VNRLEKEMGLLDFQNDKVMNSPVESSPPREAVTLKQALAYSGVVYLRGGLDGGQQDRQPSLGPAHSAVSSFPSLATAAAVAGRGGPEAVKAEAGVYEGKLTAVKVKLCRSEFCCPWSGQVRHARHVVEKRPASLPPTGTASSPAGGKAATATAVVVMAAKPTSSSGSVWSNVMPIPPRLASAVVSGSTPKLKTVGGQKGDEDVNNNVKPKGGSDSSLSTKSKKRSLGRFNSHFEKVRIKKKGKQNK